jgi:phospholipid/cholesterol/gamma-HCH transport system substrate-binding protein
VIVIRIGVLPDTPITKGTWGEIATQGVTGISNVDLRDDGADPTKVVTSSADPYEIPVRPGFLQKLQHSGVGMLEDGEAVLNDMRAFVSQENAQRFAAILQNVETLSASLNQSVNQLQPTIDRLPALVTQLDQTLQQIDAFGANVTSLSQSAKQTIDFLNSPSGPLQLAAKSLSQLQQAAAQLQSSTLPEVNRMIDNIAQASKTFNDAARDFERSPQSILFGPAPVQPGPGEAGFTGFKQEVLP